MNFRNTFAFLFGICLMACGHAQTLRIGVTPGALADSVQVAAQEARKQGLDVKVVEFTDWIIPNLALVSGDIDVNYFQHQAFLDDAIKARGYKLESVGIGILPNIGLYSLKIKRFDELKNGAHVGVANDPVNQGRGLALFEKAGLIKLRDGVGVKGTVNDIVVNPKKLKFVEVEGPQLVRAIEDLDLVQGYPGHFVNAGKSAMAGSALLFTGITDTYFAIRFVARTDNAGDARIKKFIKIYQDSTAVREQISKSYAGNFSLYSLPWLSAK